MKVVAANSTFWNRRLPSGLYRVIAPLIVPLVMLKQTFWPALPSNNTRAILFAVATLTVVVVPIVVRWVETASEGEYGGCTTNRSAVLIAFPSGVATLKCPEPATGIVAAIVVGVAELGRVSTTLTLTLLLSNVDSKFVPVMLRAAPGAAIEGVKPVMVGPPLELGTVNGLPLVA